MKKLGFGLMRLPITDSENPTSIDPVAFEAMVDKFMERGFSYYDTAYMYHGGASETAFREAVVNRYPRESFTVTDKMPMFMIKNKEQMEEIFNEQLGRCGVEYFDYYWLHALKKDSFDLAQQIGAFDFIQQKKAEGKIRHTGFSFHDSAEVLDEILTAHPEMEYVQLQINYIDWDNENIQSEKCYNVAVKHNKPVIIMEPIKGGALANVPEKAEKFFKDYHPDMSVASWAVRYAASLENVVMVLSGMSNMEQVEDNLSYMQNFVPLNSEESTIIEQAADIIKNNIAIPCTGCNYCTEGCPQNIAIPDYFSVYNNMKRINGIGRNKAKAQYDELAKQYGKPSECIECGQCERVCPQHLEIITHLKKVSSELE